MMKQSHSPKNSLLKGIAICTMSVFLLTGCGSTPQAATQTALADTGYMILSVNPEIRISYNKDGVVTDLQGKNDDGKQIVADYTDYIGKDCDTVVSDLIKEIHAAGYFVDDIDGNGKNIVIQIEPGSVVPDDDFVSGISKRAQDTVKQLQFTSSIVAIDEDDYDDKYDKIDKPSQYITLAKAQEIALKQAGVNASDARFDDKEFDFDDGTPIYELEFTAKGIEYEYDIHAVSGKVLKAERDRDDDRDDDWDDDDRAPQARPADNRQTKRITLDEAVAIALNHANVRAEDARFDDKEFDMDDGVPLYELEFIANGVEYEYDIHAESGKILKAEQERDDDDDRDDDWDDDDDDDDWDD